MTIFYFTSTGNSLAVAKQIGGTLISIPQIIDRPTLHYKDDVIGLIFPIYGFGTPKMVHTFLTKCKLEADYRFVIGTYGNIDGSAMLNVQALAKQHGNPFDYANSLLMLDNYLPIYNVTGQIARLPKKRVEENLATIQADIQNRKKRQATSPLHWRVITGIFQHLEGVAMSPKQAQRYIVNPGCTQCGICAKVCPTNNITVTDQVVFGDKCDGCLGCLHICPKNAIHMKSERSSARWRHPDVTLQELIVANNRQ